MFVTGDSIVYSASDLAAAARCQYALLREFDAKLGRGPAVAVDDELMARAAVLGSAHEGRRLDQLRHEFGDAVAIIGRPAYTPAGLAAAADATRRAIANHAPVVYQAAMFDGRFVGFADFLIRDGHRYRVADTKLARSPTVTALLQLAAYADALVHSGVPVAADAELELGDGTIVRYRVGELIPVYRSQRALLQRLLDGHYTAGTAVRWDDERVQACFRCPQCTERLRASDDLLLVGGMRVRQRDKLLEAGITTIAELADHTAPVPGLTTNAGTVDKFQGGQAPVVFISMTASSADDVPRGISFLLNRNRLNVAVSRAQYAAVIVRSELLTQYLPATPDGLVDLGAFLGLTSTS